MENFFGKVAALIEQHPRLVLATVVSTGGSAPREAGARMAVLPDRSIVGTVGGGRLESLVIDDALEVLASGRPKLARYDLTEEDRGGIGAVCGGHSEVFLEPVDSAPHLVIVGAGHVGLALARLAVVSGFRVTVVDDRAEWLAQAASGVERLERGPDDPSLRELISARTALVVVTRGHELDREALRNLAEGDAFYMGMIGSKAKVAKEMKALREAGVDPAALDRVHAPIGLDIGSETPAEIAVAILAEIVAVYRRGETPAGSLVHVLRRASRGKSASEP